MHLGLIAFVIGAVILLQRFDVVPPETWSYLWPSILVVAGIKMMVSGGCASCCSDGPCDTHMPEPAPKTAKKAPAKRKTTRRKK